jgi:hypothetical protein
VLTSEVHQASVRAAETTFQDLSIHQSQSAVAGTSVVSERHL